MLGSVEPSAARPQPSAARCLHGVRQTQRMMMCLVVALHHDTE